MTISKVEKQIFLELIEEIDSAHDFIWANTKAGTHERDNLIVAGKKLMKLKSLVQLI